MTTHTLIVVFSAHTIVKTSSMCVIYRPSCRCLLFVPSFRSNPLISFATAISIGGGLICFGGLGSLLLGELFFSFYLVVMGTRCDRDPGDWVGGWGGRAKMGWMATVYRVGWMDGRMGGAGLRKRGRESRCMYLLAARSWL